MQSRGMSFVEAISNTAVGFLVAVLANEIVLPAHGYEVTLADSVSIAVVFTAISVFRSYVVRRVFNGFGFGTQTQH